MALRLLVVEGSTAEARALLQERGFKLFGEAYADVLRSLAPDAVVDICFPADAGANLPARTGLADYDGAAITGSALNLWKAEPESLRQVEFAREIFASRIAFFGSCWGLQVASVAAGGSVRQNPKGRELAIARKIMLTDAGRAHPMHAGRPLAFDAPAVHGDEVGALPGDITITAYNAYSDVQAAEIRHGGGVFWGVQYHPEYTLADIAATLLRYDDRAVSEGFYNNRAALDVHVSELRELAANPSRTDIAWRLGLDRDILDPASHLTEIANWLCAQVRPTASARSRA
jgi:GMP synthase (glutamine-hydrolysing)